MIDNLIVKVPDKLELRAYTWQLINQNFGLSENVRNYLADLNSGFQKYDKKMDLDLVSDDEIKIVLEKSSYQNLIPEYIYFFKNGDSPSDEKVIATDYKKIPELFTNVREIYRVNNIVEFIVMEYFNNQIQSLFDQSGNNLLGYCHDIEIGTNDMILARSSDSVWWGYYKYTSNGLDLIDIHGNWDIPEDFDHINGRKVEIFHPNKNENPQLILKHEEVSYKNNKSEEEDSSNGDELSDLPF
jgi:hypothetical protein